MSSIPDPATTDWVPLAGAVAGGLPADTVVAAATRIIANKKLAGDANNAWRVMGDGKMEWGAGGASALDTNLFRSGPDLLLTDDNFWARQSVGTEGLYYVETNVPPDTRMVFESYRNPWLGGDDFRIWGSGRMQWGGGTSAPDTNLYRYASGILATDGQIYLRGGANSYLAFQFPGEQARFFIGPSGEHNWGSGAGAQDTNLYRQAADTLKTDDSLVVAGNLSPFTLNAGSYVRANTAVGATEVVMGYNGSATAAAFVFGTNGSWDTNLYRYAANHLATDDTFHAGIGQALYTAAYVTRGSGDASDRFQMLNSGHMYWSDGAASGWDISMYRWGVAYMRIEGGLSLAGAVDAGGTISSRIASAGAVFLSATQLPAGGWVATIQRAGDTGWRYLLDVDGKHYWGPGLVTGSDVSLYRSAVGWLKLEGGFEVGAAGIKFSDGSVQTVAASGGISGILYSTTLVAAGNTLQIPVGTFGSQWAAIEIIAYIWQAGATSDRTNWGLRLLPSQDVVVSHVGYAGNSGVAPANGKIGSGVVIPIGSFLAHTTARQNQPIAGIRLVIHAPSEGRRHLVRFDSWSYTDFGGTGNDMNSLNGRILTADSNIASTAITGVELVSTAGAGFGINSRIWARGIGAHVAGF